MGVAETKTIKLYIKSHKYGCSIIELNTLGFSFTLHLKLLASFVADFLPFLEI